MGQRAEAEEEEDEKGRKEEMAGRHFRQVES
jgi:hypothetical protein